MRFKLLRIKKKGKHEHIYINFIVYVHILPTVRHIINQFKCSNWWEQQRWENRRIAQAEKIIRLFFLYILCKFCLLFRFIVVLFVNFVTTLIYSCSNEKSWFNPPCSTQHTHTHSTQTINVVLCHFLFSFCFIIILYEFSLENAAVENNGWFVEV